MSFGQISTKTTFYKKINLSSRIHVKRRTYITKKVLKHPLFGLYFNIMNAKCLLLFILQRGKGSTWFFYINYGTDSRCIWYDTFLREEEVFNFVFCVGTLRHRSYNTGYAIFLPIIDRFSSLFFITSNLMVPVISQLKKYFQTFIYMITI